MLFIFDLIREVGQEEPGHKAYAYRHRTFDNE